MAELPSHPDSDADGDVGSRARSSRRGWAPRAGIAVAVAVVVLAVLHMTGVVGPGSR